jgi:hypothetical protein
VFAPNFLSVTLAGVDATGENFVAKSPLQAALQAGDHATFYLSGTAVFTTATYSDDNVAGSMQTAMNVVVSRVSPVRFYLTDNGIRAVHPEYYAPVTTQVAADGTVSLSYANTATLTEDTFQATVKGSSISVSYTYARSYLTGDVEGALGIFTATLTEAPTANWLPPPPYNLKATALAGTANGVTLTWNDDNPAGFIQAYQVSRNQVALGSVMTPQYLDSVGLTCDILGECSAMYEIVSVPVAGSSSIAASLSCTSGFLTPLSCTPGW